MRNFPAEQTSLMTVESMLMGITITMPTVGSAQYNALKSVVRRLLTNFFLNESECNCIATLLNADHELGPPIIDVQATSIPIAEQLARASDDQHILPRLVQYIQQVKPGLWRERIWPYVHPHFFLPARDNGFVGRHRECIDILEALRATPSDVVIISGVNGIGKTALALEVAHLCIKQANFESIFWISIQEGTVTYPGQIHDWIRWMRELNSMLGWNIPIPSTDSPDELSVFSQRCRQKLIDGPYLVCVDGLEDIQADRELVDFLRALNGAACRAIVTTTTPALDTRFQFPLKGWELEDTAFWLRRTGLAWNIASLKEPDQQEIEDIYTSTEGIPLALMWRSAQLATQPIANDPSLQELQGMTGEQLLSRIFAASFARLDPQAERALLALSFFELPATRSAWAGSAAISEADLLRSIEQLSQLLLIKGDTVHERFFLLASTRAFARDQLHHQPALSQALRRSWIRYYEAFCEYNGGKNRRRYANLYADWANVWQVAQYVIERWNARKLPLTAEDHEFGLSLLRLADRLRTFCRLQGLWDELTTLFFAVMQAAEELHEPLSLGPLAYLIGWMYCSRGELGNARILANQSMDKLQRLGSGTGYALRLYARIERQAAGSTLSKQHPAYQIIQNQLQQAQAAFEREDDRDGLARVLVDRGNISFRCKDYEQARIQHCEALEYFLSVDDFEGIATSYINLGDVDVGERQFLAARQHYLEALKIAKQSGDVESVAEAERGLLSTMRNELPRAPDEDQQIYLQRVRDLAVSASTFFVNLGMSTQAADVQSLLDEIERLLSVSTPPVSSPAEQTDRHASVLGVDDPTQIVAPNDGRLEIPVHQQRLTELMLSASQFLTHLGMSGQAAEIQSLLDEIERLLAALTEPVSSPEEHTDQYTPYIIGLDQLVQKTGPRNQRYSEVLVYQQRLKEIIREARLYGDTDTLRANRARMISQLNEIARSELAITFDQLCATAGSNTDAQPPEPAPGTKPPPRPREVFLDVDLHISADGSVRVRTPEGEAAASIPLALPAEYDLAMQLIEQNTTNETLLTSFGQRLYELLFSGAIDVQFQKTEAVARNTNRKARIRLAIEPDALSRLPWEFLYRKQGGYFLATNPDTVVARYMDLPLPRRRSRRRSAPLHMLTIIANPSDYMPLNVDRWEQIIRKSLAVPLEQQLLTMRTVKHATVEELRRALLEHKPDIVQFVGHGGYHNGKAYLALVDSATGETWQVDDAAFATLFSGADEHLSLVSLATCESGKSDSPQALFGLAPQLVQSGVPAVVAMQYVALVTTAEIFLQNFYEAVALRKPIDWAVQWARGAVAIKSGTGNREFATPVLYMRAPDGRIF